jgi:hypothetical protein
MTPSIKDFAKNFQTVETEQLKKVIGGNGYSNILSFDRRRRPRY